MTDNNIDYEKLADAMIGKLREMNLSRREMLAALTGAGAAGLGVAQLAGQAQAQSITGIVKADQLGTSSEPVQELYVQNQTNFNETETFDDLTVNNSATVDTLSADELSIGEQSARIFRTSGQTISSGSVTTVAWDSEDTDHSPGDLLTVDTANNKITIEKDGLYRVKARIGFGSPGSGTQIVGRVAVDGNDKDEDSVVTSANNRENLNPNDTVAVTSSPVDATVSIFQDSGGDKLTDSSEKFMNFTVTRLG